MRVSVLTGLLALTLCFGLSSAKAEAAPIQLLTNETNQLPLTEIAVSTNEVAQHVLQKTADTEAATTSEEVTVEQIPQTHVVQKNETLIDIAQAYDTSWERIFYKNDSIENPDIIEPGTTLIIPAIDEELTNRSLPEPEVVAETETPRSVTRSNALATREPVVHTASTPAKRNVVAGNSYTWGQCTWYVKNKRPDMPNNLGNAYSWYSRAAAQGYATGSTPRVGAVAQRNNHVAFVEAVHGDGTITISEMNFGGAVGRVNHRTVAASSFRYIY